MKINKLTLCNIGPYVSTHVLDFNMLDNSLFLITGATGAGKTYIFDSICFALYGSSSGGMREPKDFLSKYCSKKDKGYVSLDFEIHNKKYNITRVLKQGLDHGNPVIKYECLLKLENGEVITKLNEVKAKINEILGLTLEQFKMVMLIAQGDFYSLINSDSNERQKILRTILNTNKLALFSTNLSDMSRELKNKCSSSLDSIKAIKERFDFDCEFLTYIKGDVLTSNIIKDINLEIINEYNELEKIKNDINKLDKEYEELNVRHSNALSNNTNLELYNNQKKNYLDILSDSDKYKKIENNYDLAIKRNEIYRMFKDYESELNRNNDYLNTINKNKNIINDNTSKLDDLKIKLDKAKNDSLTTSSLEVKKSELLKTIKCINRFNELKNDISLLEKTRNSLKDEINGYNESKIPLLNKIEELTKIATNPSKDSELLDLLTKKNNASDKYKTLEGKIFIINDYLSRINNLKLLDSDLFKARNELNKQKDKLNNYEQEYFKSIAGILAANLTQDSPCPVCGSIHHPNIAKIEGDVSKEELDKLKMLVEYYNTNYNNKKDSFLAFSESTKAVKKNIEDLLECEVDESNVSKTYLNKLKLLSSNLLDVTNKYDEVKKYEDARKSSISDINSLNGKIKLIDDDIASLSQKLNKANEEISSKNGELASLNINDFDLNSINLQINDINKKIILLNNNLENSTNDYNLINNLMIEAKAIIDTTMISYNKSNILLKELKDIYEQKLVEYNFISIDEVMNNLISLDELNNIKASIDNYKNNLSNSLYLLNKYISLGYDKLNLIDLNSIFNEIENVRNLKKELSEKGSILNSKYLKNKNNLDDLIAENSKSEDLYKKYLEISELSDVANGNLSGVRIDFETYYQKQVFDQIIKVASYKYNKMTNGRFYLISGNPKDLKSKAGLEIAVKDNFNGEVRPVASLSGGESFQASMALALAFAEIISARCGGVELNSMFIDEGFGTLDSEMLENTKKILLEIGNSTNRRIGIISHIEELERSISSKVIVKKTDKGSSFVIKND